MIPPGIIVDSFDGSQARNNKFFEWEYPPDFTVRLTPAAGVSQVLYKGKVVAAFKSTDSYSVHQFCNSYH